MIGILGALLFICLILWATRAILGVMAIPDPFKTIIWVVVVVICGVIAINIMMSLASSASFSFPWFGASRR